MDDIEALRQKIRTDLETFLATEVMSWEDRGYGWYDTEYGICLYATGQNSRIDENWHPSICYDQAMHVWNKMNLAANITFDPNERIDSKFRYTIKLIADRSTGFGNTIQEAMCSVVGNKYGWRFEDD